jgi:hypothetical protein
VARSILPIHSTVVKTVQFVHHKEREREQRTENREQRTENKEQRKKKKKILNKPRNQQNQSVLRARGI